MSRPRSGRMRACRRAPPSESTGGPAVSSAGSSSEIADRSCWSGSSTWTSSPPRSVRRPRADSRPAPPSDRISSQSASPRTAKALANGPPSPSRQASAESASQSPSGGQWAWNSPQLAIRSRPAAAAPATGVPLNLSSARSSATALGPSPTQTVPGGTPAHGSSEPHPTAVKATSSSLPAARRRLVSGLEVSSGRRGRG